MALSLSSVAQTRQAIATARDVAFGSYFLPRGAMRDALAAAARRGAHVAVTLQRDPYRNPFGKRANADAARELRAAGATVSLLPSERVPFHLKAAVCDGTAYLDDRNWTLRGPEIVVRDTDAIDVALVRTALSGTGGSNAALATRKDEAIAREVRLIDEAAGTAVVAETERVARSPLTRALERHAAAGAPTTLIVPRDAHRSAREAATIRALMAAGVTVRQGGVNEKLAVAGDRAWIGSGNATGTSGRGAGQLEFGLLTRDAALVGAVRTALARDTR